MPPQSTLTNDTTLENRWRLRMRSCGRDVSKSYGPHSNTNDFAAMCFVLTKGWIIWERRAGGACPIDVEQACMDLETLGARPWYCNMSVRPPYVDHISLHDISFPKCLGGVRPRRWRKALDRVDHTARWLSRVGASALGGADRRACEKSRSLVHRVSTAAILMNCLRALHMVEQQLKLYVGLWSHAAPMIECKVIGNRSA